MANAASNTPPNIKIKVVAIVQFPSVATAWVSHCSSFEPPRSGLSVLGVSEPRQFHGAGSYPLS